MRKHRARWGLPRITRSTESSGRLRRLAVAAAGLALTVAGTGMMAGTAQADGAFTRYANMNSDKCLDGNAAGDVYASTCQSFNPWMTWAQQYDRGWWVHGATGRCLDSDRYGKVYTSPCQTGNQHQQWQHMGSSVYMNRATGLCLANSLGSSVVYAKGCDIRDPNQRWEDQ